MTRLAAPALAALAFALLAAPATGSASGKGDGASVEDLFDKANEAFWAGEYEKAAQTYSQLEELGVRSPELSFNLATAEARLGNLGRAVLHYERVLRREPGHEDTVHNLTTIRDFIARRASEAGRDADLAPAAGPWRAVLDRFSPKSAAVAFLVFHLALFTLLIARRFVNAEMARLTLGVLVGVLAVLTVSTGSVCTGKWDQERNLHEGIVLVGDTVDVMEGPDSEVKRFALEEGSRIIIVEETDGWVKIRDDQGRDGWTRDDQIGEI